MKVNYNKAYWAIYSGDKLPRKIKKLIFGKRKTKSKIRLMLKAVEVLDIAGTMYETPEIKPHLFCPYCGCTEQRGTGNKTQYPEWWEYFYCLRCGKMVGFIDNSPFHHILEYLNKETLKIEDFY